MRALMGRPNRRTRSLLKFGKPLAREESQQAGSNTESPISETTQVAPISQPKLAVGPKLRKVNVNIPIDMMTVD